MEKSWHELMFLEFIVEKTLAWLPIDSLKWSMTQTVAFDGKTLRLVCSSCLNITAMESMGQKAVGDPEGDGWCLPRPLCGTPGLTDEGEEVAVCHW